MRARKKSPQPKLKPGWGKPNTVGYEIGIMMGEPHKHARSGGRGWLGEWRDAGLLETEHWPPPTNPERPPRDDPRAAVNCVQAKKIAAEILKTGRTRLPTRSPYAALAQRVEELLDSGKAASVNAAANMLAHEAAAGRNIEERSAQRGIVREHRKMFRRRPTQ